MTRRDYEVIEFIRDYKIASTDTIQQLFFPSLRVCQNRLKILTEKGHLKRTRDSLNNQYVYYIKKPPLFRHSLLVTDFYREMAKICKVEKFKLEPNLEKFRADAAIGYVYNGKNHTILLEVEISHKGFDYKKYEGFNYSKFFPVKPKVIVVGDKVKPPPANSNFVVLPTTLDGLRFVIR